MIITDEHRKAAKETQRKKSMTRAQIDHLRQIAEADKGRRCDESRFASALASVTPTPENLKKLIDRCYAQAGNFQIHSPKVTHLDRRAVKLLYWIQAKGFRLGTEIATPSDITFLSNLTADEIKMSDARFEAEWKVKKVFKHPDPVVPGEKRCTNKWCRKGPDKSRGIVPPRSKGGFCSQACRDVCKPPASPMADAQVLAQA
jgi:hypothetical protein